MVPATGEGTSVSTLSVDTSRRGSSTATVSPTFFSQRVMVPSVTDSPSSGISTSVASPDAFAASSCLGSSLASALGSSALVSSLGSSAAASSPSSPSSAMTAPTSTVSSSLARILSRTPAAGEGISVSTLSVETSSKGSSAATVSPTFFSQRVMVPSVTDSPSSGISTENAIVSDSLKVVLEINVLTFRDYLFRLRNVEVPPTTQENPL